MSCQTPLQTDWLLLQGPVGPSTLGKLKPAMFPVTVMYLNFIYSSGLILAYSTIEEPLF